MEKINKKELTKLFIEIKKNDAIAFENLYRMYNKLIYRIAFSIVKNKQDAEDVVQIVFAKLYSIDKHKLPSKSEASWLYAITKNEAINFLKKRNHHISLDDIYETEDSNDEIKEIIDKESYNKLISGFNNQEKEIISLKILANLSFDEIGEILKIPTGTIKWKYYKSIHTLKALLSNLAMFIITALLSIVTFKKEKNTNLPVNPETNTVNKENNRQENMSETIYKEETKKDNNSIFESDNSQTQENSIEIPNISHNSNYVGLSFLGISMLFFIITIIFSIIFTKHQLKRRKKLSK